MRTITSSRGVSSTVSDEDWDYLSQFKWCQHKKGYFCVSSRVEGAKGQRMHRMVACRMGIDTSSQIDHIDGDKTNNQRSNLRSADNGQNRANSKRNINNKSGFKGVHLRKPKVSSGRRKTRCDKSDIPRWVSQINVNGEKIHLGYFASREEAAAKYAEAAAHYFGEFAKP